MQRRSGLKPLCGCGCGQRVRQWRHRYLTPAHVPHAVRSQAGAKGRRAYAFAARAKRFEATYALLTREGRRLTKETILTVFAEIERTAYRNGYHASEAKWVKRTRAAA